MNTPALRGSRILGFGHHQPDRVLTNDELSTMVDTNDEWITTRTGIRTRRIAGPDDSVVSMAIEAGRMAVADAGLEPSDIGLVIVASTTHRERSPYTAGRVAAALGMANGPAPIDINTACSGFEYAMALADQSIRVGASDTALVIGSETLSSIADWTDRSTCVLVGDGAGAVVIGAADTAEIGPVSWGSVPHLNEAVLVTRDPEYFTQQGRSIYRWAITEAEGHARAVVDAAGVTLDDIGVLAFHQANLRIIEPLAEALGGGDKYVVRDVVESGNTSAASVPLGLSKAWHRGELPEDTLALLFGFGGGFAHAGQVVRTPKRRS
ncbi:MULTISPECIES: beta-ketoacyl-ACP synthase 3 [unclassified Curtobacterium]|uniref:beta-ketoacyl-ACP synthase 3 n=1 Tax=unclassified Curtobacterium TaxID=257496 RepID=UPI001AE91132|nr:MULTISPECIES: beta-ketoacyl-ACP synthase 3 [unclassified Curtobacterium]MBP1300479.1 3-oxoacyl-[acyl-carrier-protein] synthase-3 [Curtobacterium sp. 1310]MCM3505990.1 beta-ketoacyl-ACP synthase 3 [Curtobacterium sp. ODYSSEY 48 V2]MDB6426848.1 beta-ketoacyl-ACP synthase 3 [Curtobacterium sp. 20TX0008]MDP9736969.1 3-oxoacyl-[acyl-carrier-protein] synthase-3 [Curtobacterium sp. 260]MDT0209313.1 beta-ketoacyl-ACP synthase 3 [Curtobacterium sp. BRD11]